MYLRENKIKAVPYDKGLGFCLMSEKDYHDRLDKIIELEQFEFHEKTRINEKDPILKEEERINGELKSYLREVKLKMICTRNLDPQEQNPPGFMVFLKFTRKILH